MWARFLLMDCTQVCSQSGRGDSNARHSRWQSDAFHPKSLFRLRESVASVAFFDFVASTRQQAARERKPRYFQAVWSLTSRSAANHRGRATQKADPQSFQLVAACWKDEALKARFMSDPKAVLAERGIDMPEEMNIKIVENSGNTVHITMPKVPTEQLQSLTKR